MWRARFQDEQCELGRACGAHRASSCPWEPPSSEPAEEITETVSLDMVQTTGTKELS
jgi:hypothetical protein